jgi:hypothetical protein
MAGVKLVVIRSPAPEGWRLIYRTPEREALRRL